MKIVNIMNFARAFEPRDPVAEAKLPETTVNQLRLCNRLGLEATFLLQYDVLANESFVDKIKAELQDNIELGFWYEVVEPLTSACGIPYESENGWKWDWHIKPGFSMSYPKHQRELLIDEAMRKFREIFGYYPRTVGSWLLDTHTVNYLADNYDIDAFCFCRDQVNTDAYTLVGGYFNQGYYPSRNNMFTPASTLENQVNVPIFRLLGPDPLHNYDNEKFTSKSVKHGPYTMEVALLKTGGGNPEIVDWYLRNYFETESLGFAYMQIGQENSFNMFDITDLTEMQIKKILAYPDVKIEKMCDTGRAFKERYRTTPATAVCALDNWDTPDLQTVYYDSKFYTASIMRRDGDVFIRALYFFDDRIKDLYDGETCDTYDAVYENMPVIDTLYQRGETDGGLGLILDAEAEDIKPQRIGDSSLKISWNDKSVIFHEDSVLINNCKLSFTPMMFNTKICVHNDRIEYEYKTHKYALVIEGGTAYFDGDTIHIAGDAVALKPCKI